MNDSSRNGKAQFDLLRARLEVELPRPAIIAMASCSVDDGQTYVARAIAKRFAAVGYATLTIDSTLEPDAHGDVASDLHFAEIADRQARLKGEDGLPRELALNDRRLQASTSARELRDGLDTLRGTFDYLVFVTQPGAATAFATAILESADAVIACVQARRKRKPADVRLGENLDRLGDRYFGVIAIDREILRQSRRSAPVAHMRKAGPLSVDHAGRPVSPSPLR